ncbi:jg22439 [Pararge aegeria aegeria]|uniref:Jg22439 protein n=1 Tax=Pararge aegeria aegeria TaxID=348720 RepID=A0A8S4QYB0_9NEOP|nr:jg22439 [Pararge aegeria aegeria]
MESPTSFSVSTAPPPHSPTAYRRLETLTTRTEKKKKWGPDLNHLNNTQSKVKYISVPVDSQLVGTSVQPRYIRTGWRMCKQLWQMADELREPKTVSPSRRSHASQHPQSAKRADPVAFASLLQDESLGSIKLLTREDLKITMPG